MLRPALCALSLLIAGVATAQEDAHYTIANFSPASGPPGTKVTINGSGAGIKTVAAWVNGVPATYDTPTLAYQLVLTIPAGATTGPIVISNGPSKATSPTNFIVTGSSSTGGTTGSSTGNSSTGSSTGTTTGSTTGGTTSGGGTGVIDPPPHITPPSTAVTTHPRLWIRNQDLNRLRGWATQNNPIWNDLVSVANKYRNNVLQGIVPQQDNGDGEGNGYAYPTEEYAELFAFMSLVDPNATNRADWAKKAHDLMMYMMNRAVLGPADGQPFRTPHFGTYNRSRWWGEAFPLVVDWCYSTFTPAEKATIRQVFIRWIHEMLDYKVSGGGYTISPAGVVNSTSLISSPGQIRWSGNNYWCNHARNIGMMSLAMDAADDVPAATGDYKAGYLGDYIGNAIGAYMYIRNYAETHDLRGGLSPEGPGYGESSESGLTMLMLAMHTAGYDNAATYGPAAELYKNPFWATDLTTAYLHSMSPQTATFYNWMPLMYLPAGFGDVLRFETNDMVRAFGPLAVMDIADGKLTSQRLNDIRWIIYWMSPGGPSNQHTRLAYSYQNYGTMLPLMYFLMFDPQAPAPSDPHVGMPTQYIAPGLNRILSRTDWGTGAAWFMFISTFNNLDHQWGDSNSFSFYRNGEWLTKEWSGYGKNISASDYQNNLSIQNPPSGAGVPSFNVEEGNHGGQFSYTSDGDPTVKTSLQTAYVFAEGDVTKRYNGTGIHATDVAHASRSIFWMKPDMIVVYDRATSKSANRYKRTYFNFATQPSVSGHGATVTTPKGQKVFFTSLLPQAGTVTWDKPTTTWSWNEATEDEPMHYRICVQDTSNPLDVRFLNILQGADSNGTPVAATSFKQSSGSGYDGAWFGNTAVLFAVNLGQAFTGVTYTVPTTITSHYVTGLTPGAAYTVTKQTGANGLTVTISAGGTCVADSAGVLHF